MKHNKIIVILMAIVLLAVTFVSAANLRTQTSAQEAESGQQPPTRIPDIPHVMVAGYEQDEYFELSLKVSAKRFQTAGVVLSYDAAALTPVGWTSGGLDEDGNPTVVSLDGNLTWSNPAVLPTKGTDELAGKPALCYVQRNEDGTPKRGYFYLGADTLKYTDLLDERVVTVRFRKAAGTKVTMPTEPGSDVTDETKFTVCLATEDVAKDAIPGGQVLLTVQGGTDPLKRCGKFRHTTGPILPDDTTPTTPEPTAQELETAEDAEGGGETEPTPADYDCTLSFGFWDGPSADSSGGGSGDYAITFFDWDGRVIDAIAAPENAEEAVQEWIQNNQWVQDRLKKPGYDFDNWIVVYEHNDGSGLTPQYGSYTSRRDIDYDSVDEATKKFDTRDIANFKSLSAYDTAKENPSKSILVQAAYKTNKDVNGGVEYTLDGKVKDPNVLLKNTEKATGTLDLNNPSTRYTFSALTYYQYGVSLSNTNGSYAVRGTVYRGNTLRANKPTIQAQVVTASGEVTVKIDLENTDEASFELVVPKTTSQVYLYIRDTDGVANWTVGDSRSDRNLEATGTKIIREGAFETLVDEAFSGSYAAATNTILFSDAGFPHINSDAKVKTAQDRLRAESAAQNRKLTRDEVTAQLNGI